MLQNHTLQFELGSLVLNDQQYEIVQAPLNQHLRVLASAGSGKTTTITAKIAHTITHLGIKAEEVVLTTFSRSGADTMRERLEKLIGSTTAYIGTFHALSLQILRQNDPTAIEGIMHTVDELPYLWLDFLKTDKGKAWSSKIKMRYSTLKRKRIQQKPARTPRNLLESKSKNLQKFLYLLDRSNLLI